MNQPFEIQNLVTSWTKFDIVKTIDIVIEEDISQYLRGEKEINTSVLINVLGLESKEDQISDLWRGVREDTELGKLFACIAALTAHHEVIHQFASKYSTKNMGGLFIVSPNSKINTNIRRALINSGATDPEYINSTEVPYDFSKLFSSGRYGTYFTQLLELRLRKIGWTLDDIKYRYSELSIQYHIHKMLGLSVAQYEDWTQGKSISKDYSFNSQIEKSIVMDGLIPLEEVSRSNISKKQSPFETISIPKHKKDDYISNDWEIYDETKNLYKIRKEKSHDLAFEDRVWALMAKMEFDYYNSDRHFRIKFSKDGDVPGKQIDVFAGSKEAVIVVECKSSEKRTSYSFQKEIDQIANNRGRINGVIRKFFSSKAKIGYLFCTNNVIINDNDKQRMLEQNILHYNQDKISYFESLTDLLGRAAKYQFLGSVFKGTEIPELPNKVPAVRGKMAGFTYYSFSIEPETLLKISYVSHRREDDIEAFESYQRMVNKTRINKISSYIDDERGYFPNSIIISIDSGKKPLAFDLPPNYEKHSISQIGILHLPKRYKSALIIDGQHRLYGYSKSVWRSRNTIPIVAFENLPASEQVRLFVDINHTQKSVPKNLLLSLISDFNKDSENDDEALVSMRISLIKLLNTKEESSLYKRIITSEEPKTELRCLTLEYLFSYGIGNKVDFFGTLKDKKLVRYGSLSDTDHKKTLNRAYSYLQRCLSYVENEVPEQWNLGQKEGGFIAMNIGVSSIFRILNDILNHIEETEKRILQKETIESLIDLTVPYLSQVTNYLKSLDSNQIKALRSKLGSTGTNHVLREFQQAIYKNDDSFVPNDLLTWISTNSGKFNYPAKIIGDGLQLKIRSFIFQELKKHHGENNKAWWVNGVPVTIQQHCSNRYIEEKRKEPEENYLDTIHYLDIVKMKDNKHLFINTFTPPGLEQKKEADKLSWFVKFNSIRKKYSHPERNNVSEEELTLLQELNSWLLPRLSEDALPNS